MYDIPNISIHALREESDEWINYITKFTQRFQSTLSVRRATKDASSRLFLISSFQSTLSVRRATGLTDLVILIVQFQSTLSVRRATLSVSHCNGYLRISIHALREESDQPLYSFASLIAFQSTLSVRRATS